MVAVVLASDRLQENFCVFLPNQKAEQRRPFGSCLVRHCPQGLFLPFFTFLRAIYFSTHLDFSSSPLSAPGSLRMYSYRNAVDLLWRPPLERKRMYFLNYDYAVQRGAENMYQAMPSSPTSKILKSNRSNMKREYAAQTQFDCSNEKRLTESWKNIFISNGSGLYFCCC